jgi:outer membrane protein assembly factor BamD
MTRISNCKALLLLLALSAACASGKDIDITKPVTGAEAANAQKAYEKGLDERRVSNYLEATRYFEWVRNNFPYSQYASLSELALADMSYERGDYSIAAAQYQDFVKNHPSHAKADYASFRVGVSYYEDKPSDFWLFPPSNEKDQKPVSSALDALQRFVLSYPKSEYVPKARDLINESRERLAQHERYVAEFYWKKGAWRGAASRWMGLADTYGDLQGGSVRSDSLWRASQAYRNLNDPVGERKALTRLVEESPGSDHVRDAQARLRELPAATVEAPTLAPEPVAPKSTNQAPAGAVPGPSTPEKTPPNPTKPPPPKK